MLTAGKKKILTLLRKNYDAKIKIVYKDIKEFNGRCSNKFIYVNSRLKTNDFIQTLFHELGHWYCYKNNIWFAFHNYEGKLSKKKKKAVMLTALRAERWVDDWGKNEYKKYYPNKRWISSYRSKRQIEYLYGYLDKLLK